jgi:hypothetical protein
MGASCGHLQPVCCINKGRKVIRNVHRDTVYDAPEVHVVYPVRAVGCNVMYQEDDDDQIVKLAFLSGKVKVTRAIEALQARIDLLKQTYLPDERRPDASDSSDDSLDDEPTDQAELFNFPEEVPPSSDEDDGDHVIE